PRPRPSLFGPGASPKLGLERGIPRDRGDVVSLAGPRQRASRPLDQPRGHHVVRGVGDVLGVLTRRSARGVRPASRAPSEDHSMPRTVRLKLIHAGPTTGEIDRLVMHPNVLERLKEAVPVM